MKQKISLTTRKPLITLIVSLCSMVGFAQTTLKIGDKAPPIKVHSWLKGEPINQLEKGVPYVLEFGATWCKPCKALIPKLSELAEKHKGKVEVISVFVMELNHEPLDTKQPKYIDLVGKYITKYGGNMQYNVAVDGTEKYMENNWVRATGSLGVPQTFVIDKEGYIAMFDNNNITDIDKLLTAMENGTYNRNEVISDAKKKKESEISYDRFKPLFVNGNGGQGEDFVYRSIISRYKGDFKGGPPPYLNNMASLQTERWRKELGDSEEAKTYIEKHKIYQYRIQLPGTPLGKLYHLAYTDSLYNEPFSRMPSTMKFPDTIKFPKFRRTYGKTWHEPILEVSVKSPFNWEFYNPKNKWNYVLNVPEKSSTRRLQKLMQEDLDRYFCYDITLEIRNMPCWFIKAKPNALKKIKTKTPGEKFLWPNFEYGDGDIQFKNAEMRDIIYLLHSNLKYSYESTGKLKEINNPVFVDKVSVVQEIDFVLTRALYNKLKGKNDVAKWNAANEFLENNGLYMEKGTKPMKVVVIRDPKTNKRGQ